MSDCGGLALLLGWRVKNLGGRVVVTVEAGVHVSSWEHC